MKNKPTYEELLIRNQKLEIDIKKLESQISLSNQEIIEHNNFDFFFEKIFRNNEAIILLLNSETGSFVDVNFAAEKFYGFTLEQFKQMKIGDINKLPPDELSAEIENAVEEKRKFFIFPHQLANGEIRTVEVHSTPIVMNDLKYLVSIVHDITEQKQAEKELINAKEKAEKSKVIFKAISEETMDGISLVDLKGNYVFVNPAFCKMLGYSEQELLKMNIADLKISSEVPENFENLKKIQTNTYTNIELQRKDKSIIIIEIHAKIINIENRKFALGAMRDITERMEAEKELIKAKEKAEESNRLKSSFLQNMSHEVRTPLNAIVGFSQLIAKPNQKQEKFETFAKLISKSSDKLIQIITDVIEISEVQSKIIKPILTKFDVTELISEIVFDFIQLAKEKNINLSFHKSFENNKLIINSDREKLKRILTHLIDNAIKFTIQGTVTIYFELKEDTLFFTITDTGIGISDNMKTIIFEPFRQVETGSTRNFGGNGLGLSLVKAFTELLNGSISLKSEINKGTEIQIAIPINNNNTEKVSYQNIKLNYSIRTVLIAEDEYTNYLYLTELLEEYNFKILYAENGQKALDMCRSNAEVDLIFMDIKMPILDGYEAAKLIKEFRPYMPIIAQTAYALDSEKENFIGIFDDYITKPISEEILNKKLIKYIDK